MGPQRFANGGEAVTSESTGEIQQGCQTELRTHLLVKVLDLR